MRTSNIVRKTNETSIDITLALDGTGKNDISTGIGFFDHMLEQLSFHSRIDMTIKAKGDLHIDAHHTVEDCGLTLGQCLLEALHDKKGIQRYGSALLPMDETLTQIALDFSGRPYFVANMDCPTEKVGDFDCQLAREFFKSLSTESKMTLHINVLYGHNSHHIIESCFKGVAQSIKQAIAITSQENVASTKGIL